jgi:hypothetical protein
VKVYWGEFWILCFGQAVGGDLDMEVLIGGEEELAAIQWQKSMLREGCDGTILFLPLLKSKYFSR